LQRAGSALIAARITLGRGNLTLNRLDGSPSFAAPIGGGSATTFFVGNVSLPVVPNPDNDATVSEEDKINKVRYVRIVANATQFLHFKVRPLDATWSSTSKMTRRKLHTYFPCRLPAFLVDGDPERAESSFLCIRC